MDHLQLARIRGTELRAAAAAHRLARECRRRGRRPALPVRLYCRFWWAARPRAAVWTPELLPSA